MRTLAERLLWARERKGLTQMALADRSGVSQSTIGNLESGLRLSARRIVNIAEAVSVDPLWLAEGRGEPEGKSGRKSNEAASDSQTVNDRIEKVRADAILDASIEFLAVRIGDDGDVKIPMVDLKLSAGVTGFQVEPISDRRKSGSGITVDGAFLERHGYIPERLVAVRVKGHSMEPKLSEGSVVIINTADIKPVDGAVFAINFEGEAIVKRLSRDAGEWWLTSDNPDQVKYHRKICRGGECIIVGRVVRAYTDDV